MSVCVACVAANVDPAPEATVTVLGTAFCDSHGVQAFQMSMTPGLARRMLVPSTVFGTPPIAPTPISPTP